MDEHDVIFGGLTEYGHDAVCYMKRCRMKSASFHASVFVWSLPMIFCST